jgi:hypothetical protein
MAPPLVICFTFLRIIASPNIGHDIVTLVFSAGSPDSQPGKKFRLLLAHSISIVISCAMIQDS